MNENNITNNDRIMRFRPRLAFYHPNAKGTGGAVKFELIPAYEDRDGCIMMTVANQATVGDLRAQVPVYPRFDWEKSVTVKLDFNDLCNMLQVFRGECESINDGRGMYHASANANTRIVLRHLLEPVQAYSLEVYRSSTKGDDDRRTHILINPTEALGLCESIAGSMSAISFGVPTTLPSDLRDSAEGKRVDAA